MSKSPLPLGEGWVRALAANQFKKIARDEFAEANSSLANSFQIERTPLGPHPQPFSKREKGDEIDRTCLDEPSILLPFKLFPVPSSGHHAAVKRRRE